jgi:hypothetical protein
MQKIIEIYYINLKNKKKTFTAAAGRRFGKPQGSGRRVSGAAG